MRCRVYERHLTNFLTEKNYVNYRKFRGRIREHKFCRFFHLYSVFTSSSSGATDDSFLTCLEGWSRNRRPFYEMKTLKY